LYYGVYGAFPQLPPLSRQQYRSAGVYPGLELSHYDRSKHAAVLDAFRQGHPWEELAKGDRTLAESVLTADEGLMLKAELEDQGALNCLRDTVGLLTFLLDHGGLIVYDPQTFHWWEPKRWRKRVFLPGDVVPGGHVVILTSEEPEASL